MGRFESVDAGLEEIGHKPGSSIERGDHVGFTGLACGDAADTARALVNGRIGEQPDFRIKVAHDVSELALDPIAKGVGKVSGDAGMLSIV